MERHILDLMQFFEGYVRNYRRLNLSNDHNRSMFTRREIDYFANLGEMLGFDSFVEDYKFDNEKNRSRPMDLSWWKWDRRYDEENYVYLALHLERENLCDKDEETIDKLFSNTGEASIPHNVIGIQFVKTLDRINNLNKKILEKNRVQQSNALMIYRFFDLNLNIERVISYHFTPEGSIEDRKAFLKQDELGYWFMFFEEEIG